jgi:hypothetical protein
MLSHKQCKTCVKWMEGDMDWINLAQNRDQWRVLLNAVMNFRVP